METAHYRLRKKLGLEGGDNLTNFIQELGYADKTQTEDKEHTDDGKEL
jgi:hypothetical protein